MKYEDLAAELGIDGPVIGSNMRARCPLHEGTHRNFSINLNSGVWHCFKGCGNENGGGTIVTLVAGIFGYSYVEALSFVTRFEEGWAPEPATPEMATAALTGTLEQFDSKVVPVAPFERDTRALTREKWPLWFAARGFNADDWGDWDLMMDRESGDVSIPHYGYADGPPHFLGEIRRRMPGADPKYLYTTGFPKSTSLFGMHRLPERAERVALVEGTLDAIWLWRHHVPALAIFGSHVSAVQTSLLRVWNPRSIILAFDNDEDGRRCTSEAIDALHAVSHVTVAEIPHEYKDVQDIKDSSVIDRVFDQTVSTVEFALKGY